MAIDVGTEAISRPNIGSSNNTIINQQNPANADGTITEIEAWWGGDGTNCRLGLAYVNSGNNLTFRSYAAIGNVTGGSKQTYSGLNLSVESGDYIGFYVAGTGVVWTDTASGNYWYAIANYVDGSAHDFSYDNITGLTVSLYGTGTETAAGQPLIKRFGGVPYAALNRGVF